MVDTDARQRAKRIAQERGLCGLANDTKWREFFTLIKEQQVPLEVKLIYEEFSFQSSQIWSPVVNYLEGTRMGPELFVFIEWVRSQVAKELQIAAVTVALDCEVCDGKATVYGYR